MIKSIVKNGFLIFLVIFTVIMLMITDFFSEEITMTQKNNQTLKDFNVKMVETKDIDIKMNYLKNIFISSKEEVQQKFILFFDSHKKDFNLDIKQFITPISIEERNFLTIKFNGYIFLNDKEKIDDFFELQYENGILHIDVIELKKDRLEFEFSLFENYKEEIK